jgi:DNA-binding transcriptional LysR family regulator
MHFTLRQLTIFRAVAEQLSFTRAAELLHLTQPAVSMQVRQLEANLELPLFEHLGRRVFLTEAGRELYQYSRQIDERLQEMEEVLSALKGMRGGRLRVSVATTPNEFTARMLAAFAQLHEGVSISLDVTNRANLLQHLEANECDVVIMGMPPEGLDAVAEAFLENPLVMIAAPTHPLAHLEVIAPGQLKNERLVVREEGSGTREAMRRFFADHGVEVKFSMEFGSNEALKQVVAAGLGLGLVSAHTIIQELETGRLTVLPVQDTPIVRHWYLLHRSGKRLSPVAQAFRSFVLENARDFDFLGGNSGPTQVART